MCRITTSLLTAFVIVIVFIASIAFFIGVCDWRTKQCTLRAATKTTSETFLRPLIDFIYTQATIHNPEGDVLPDQIDDHIKEEVKKHVQ